jgi:hypothetical protein
MSNSGIDRGRSIRSIRNRPGYGLPEGGFKNGRRSGHPEYGDLVRPINELGKSPLTRDHRGVAPRRGDSAGKGYRRARVTPMEWTDEVGLCRPVMLSTWQHFDSSWRQSVGAGLGPVPITKEPCEKNIALWRRLEYIVTVCLTVLLPGFAPSASKGQAGRPRGRSRPCHRRSRWLPGLEVVFFVDPENVSSRSDSPRSNDLR